MNYPYLPEGRDIKYVSISDHFMKEAIDMRNNFSTDINHPTGAVAVFNNLIVAKAANKSRLHNRKLIEFHKNKFCLRRFLKIKTGTHYWICPGCADYTKHSEAQIAKQLIGKGIKGADIYLYGHWWCCKPCWDSMIKAGINNVFLVDNATELFKK